MSEGYITIIGGGLAGCEAALACAKLGVKTKLIEMKPRERTPAHTSDCLAELVCSNSLRGESLSGAVGLLKAEMEMMGSIVMEAAKHCRVGAGGALAVDRNAFCAYITEKIDTNPLIERICQRVDTLPSHGMTIVATGPLTTDALAENISQTIGAGFLSFYDASAPLVSVDSIDMENAFMASRYDDENPDYINCPMDKEQYEHFVSELASAREVALHGFEDGRVFEACLPVEVMARRGVDVLRYGPMKPVGLRDPKTGKTPWAVVQLRRDNVAGSVYNLVGFQTHLLFPEQKRVFSLIPALRLAEFLRYGVMHRNSYIDSPKLLDSFYRLRSREELIFAGQFCGVEGYVESAASGLYAGKAAAFRMLDCKDPLPLPDTTATGALARYISTPGGLFQPMNINFGIINSEGITEKNKRRKRDAVVARALKTVSESRFAEK